MFGRTKQFLVVTVMVVVTGAIANVSRADSIDFDNDVINPIVTQPGFESYDLGEDGPSFTTTNGITVSLSTTNVSGGIQQRNRGAGSVSGNSVEGLFQDLFQAQDDDTNGTYTLTFSDLVANSPYDVTIYVYDPIWPQLTNPASMDITAEDVTNSNALGTFTIGSTPEPASLNDANISFTGNASALGVLQVDLDFVNGTAVGMDALPVNGVVIELVPEPASLALLGLGGLMILRRRNH